MTTYEYPVQISEDNFIFNVPANLRDNKDFPKIPSTSKYTLSRKGDRVPELNSGSEIPNVDAQVWYSLNVDRVFPLKVSYAEAREDQIDKEGFQRPLSEIASSMKRYLKQVPDDNTQIEEDRFDLIISQVSRMTPDDFYRDFYRYPLNPSVDSFKMARLLEGYMNTGNEVPIRRYLRELGIYSLKDHSFDYYPIYELFFLLTRLASPPLSESQIILSIRRAKTQFGSDERKFIDSIYHLYVYDMNVILDMIEEISEFGALEAGRRFDTPYRDWVKWADEYFLIKNPEVVDYIGEPLHISTPKYYTWTDQQLVNLFNQLDLDIPYRSEFFNRYNWVNTMAAIVQRYRSDSASNNQWGINTLGDKK